MAEEHEEHRADAAEVGQKLDKMLSALDGMHKRMDAMEERQERLDRGRKDAEEKPEEAKPKEEPSADAKRKDGDGELPGEPLKPSADAKRKDAAEESAEAEEKEAREEKERADAEARDDGPGKKLKGWSHVSKPTRRRRRDAAEGEGDGDEKEKEEEEEEKVADSVDIRREIDAIKRQLPRAMTEADRSAFADAQARADKVYSAYGDSARAPMAGETLDAYRRQLANGLKARCRDPKLREASLWGINDGAAYDLIDGMIYADALEAARSPDLAPHQLRCEVEQRGGHEFRTYYGSPSAWMDEIAGAVGRAGHLIRPSLGAR